MEDNSRRVFLNREKETELTIGTIVWPLESWALVQAWRTNWEMGAEANVPEEKK